MGLTGNEVSVANQQRRNEELSKSPARRFPALHPGEMLREEFLIPIGMTAEVLAKKLRVSQRITVAIIKEKRGLDGDLCLRLARFFRMTPEFWMNLQKGYELETAKTDWRRVCGEVRMLPKIQGFQQTKKQRGLN